MAALENPFGWPPNPKMLADGSAAVARARAAGAKSPRELDYIAAIETFYKDHDKVEHRTRAVAYEKAMEQLAARYPDDREAAIFYALALNATRHRDRQDLRPAAEGGRHPGGGVPGAARPPGRRRTT